MRREVVSRNRTNCGRLIWIAICCLLPWAGGSAFCLGGEPPAKNSIELSGPELFAPPTADSTGGDATALPVAEDADREETKADETDETDETVEKENRPDEKTDKQESQAEEKTAPMRVSPPEPKVLPELSPQMAGLRDRVRQTLTAAFNKPPGTRESMPIEIIHHCLVFGCDATVRNAADRNRPINAVGCLAWNFSCGEYRLMAGDGHRLMARVGYGLQQRPGQFLAVLAQSGVPADYEIRVGEQRGSVADLVEYEKLDCREGTDLSARLIGLEYYVEAGQTWTNQLGETWSVERIVEGELDRQVSGGKPELTDRLLGLSYVVGRRRQKQLPLEGSLVRAKDYIVECQNYAFELQNPDGSWHPRIFAAKGTSNDRAGLLRSNGRILEWLALSFPKDRLDDPRVAASVGYVLGLLNSRNSRRYSTSTTVAQTVDRMHALRALSLYDRRYFKPRDRKEPVSQAEAETSVTRR